MNWRLAVVPATLVPIAVIAAGLEIGPGDVLAVGLLPFAAAAAAAGAKMAVQGAKLAYISRRYLGPRFDGFWRLCGMRAGSEFVKFTTPMFVGAEVVVVYYLHRRGAPAPRASWIALVDIVTEVLAAGALSIAAGALALAAGAHSLGAIILGTSVPVTLAWGALFFLSSRREFRVPAAASRLAARAAGARGAGWAASADRWLAEVCEVSRQNMGTPETRRVLAVSLALSLAAWSLYGVSFAAAAAAAGPEVGPLGSVMAVMGANAVGNLPVTVGGSGLAEFGVVAYLNGLDPFDLGAAAGAEGWESVIGWRVATYYLPLAAAWALLVRLALTGPLGRRAPGGAAPPAQPY